MPRTLIGTAMLLFALPAAAQQSQHVEFGGDAALAFRLDSPTATTLSIPLQRVRVGFFVSPDWSIEPLAGFTYFSTSGGSVSSVVVGVGALYHFAKRPSGSDVYVRPFVMTNHVSTSGGGIGSSSGGTTSVGAGIGIKVPIVNRLAARYEAALSTSSSSTQLMLLAGLSFFTH